MEFMNNPQSSLSRQSVITDFLFCVGEAPTSRWETVILWPKMDASGKFMKLMEWDKDRIIKLHLQIYQLFRNYLDRCAFANEAVKRNITVCVKRLTNPSSVNSASILKSSINIHNILLFIKKDPTGIALHKDLCDYVRKSRPATLRLICPFYETIKHKVHKENKKKSAGFGGVSVELIGVHESSPNDTWGFQYHSFPENSPRLEKFGTHSTGATSKSSDLEDSCSTNYSSSFHLVNSIKTEPVDDVAYISDCELADLVREEEHSISLDSEKNCAKGSMSLYNRIQVNGPDAIVRAASYATGDKGLADLWYGQHIVERNSEIRGQLDSVAGSIRVACIGASYKVTDLLISKTKLTAPLFTYTLPEINPCDVEELAVHEEDLKKENQERDEIILSRILKKKNEIINIGPVRITSQEGYFTYKCLIDDCNFIETASLDLYRSHLKTEHAMNMSHLPWYCNKCGVGTTVYFGYTDFEALMRHIKESHSSMTTETHALVKARGYRGFHPSKCERTICPVKLPANPDDLAATKHILFKCPMKGCDFGSNSATAATSHFEQRVDGSSPQKCKHCLSEFKTANEHVNHTFIVHGVLRFECSYCAFKSLSLAVIFFHQDEKHSLLNHSAKKLNAFNMKLPLLRRYGHDTVLSYICGINGCKYVTNVSDYFYSHLSSQHANEEFLYCRICEMYNCFFPDDLVQHYVTHGIGLYQCIFCTMGFDSYYSWKVHFSNNHFNQFPYVIFRKCFSDDLDQIHLRFCRIKELRTDIESLVLLDVSTDMQLKPSFNAFDKIASFKESKASCSYLNKILMDPSLRVVEGSVDISHIERLRPSDRPGPKVAREKPIKPNVSLEPVKAPPDINSFKVELRSVLSKIGRLSRKKKLQSSHRPSSSASKMIEPKNQFARKSTTNHVIQPVKIKLNCSFCGFSAFEESNLTDHLKTHYLEKPPKHTSFVDYLICCHCYSNFDSFRSYLLHHRKRHTTKNSVFQAVTCSKKTPKQYYACFCLREFMTERELCNHARLDHKVIGEYLGYQFKSLYVCPLMQCKMRLKTRTQRATHMHSHRHIYSCPKCNILAGTKKIFNQVHSPECKVECPSVLDTQTKNSLSFTGDSLFSCTRKTFFYVPFKAVPQTARKTTTNANRSPLMTQGGG